MKLRHKITIRFKAGNIVQAAVVGRAAVRRMHKLLQTFFLQYKSLTPKQKDFIEETIGLLANNAVNGAKLDKFELKRLKRVINMLNKAVDSQQFKLNVVPLSDKPSDGELKAQVVMAHGDAVDHGPRFKVGVVTFPYEHGKSPKFLIKKYNKVIQEQVQRLLKQKKDRVNKFLKNNPPTAIKLKEAIMDVLRQIAA